MKNRYITLPVLLSLVFNVHEGFGQSFPFLTSAESKSQGATVDIVRSSYMYGSIMDNAATDGERAVLTPYNTGQVDPNTSAYAYAPVIMYDENSGRYKTWFCWGVAGDYIGFKEAGTLEGLNAASISGVLLPSHDNSKFDKTHACDPTLLFDNGVWYLYYGGLNEDAGSRSTEIGVATSTDGYNFTRANNGNPVVIEDGTYQSGSYGAGQPAVVKASDGFYYMILTHQMNAGNNTFKVIKSANALFIPYTPVLTIPDTWTIGGWSVDMAFNTYKNEFAVVAQKSDKGANKLEVQISNYNMSWNLVSQYQYTTNNASFIWGEGAGMISNSKKELSRLFSGNPNTSNFDNLVLFSAASYGSRPGLPDHITGPMMWAQYADNTLIPNFDISKGWDLGLYNSNSDGKFKIWYGEGMHGWFDAPTEWTWGNFSSGQVFTGDINGDGFCDVGMYNALDNGNYYIWYGDGTGNFTGQTAATHPKTANSQVFTGDFNGDGKCDVGHYDISAGTFTIGYGNGFGSFTNPTTYTWGSFPSAQVFAGDFNADGKWDIGLYNPLTNDGNFFIRYGNGNGTFSGETAWPWAYFPTAQVFTGDFNGDKKWDVGLHNPLNDGRTYIQYGTGTGSFGNQTVFTLGNPPNSKVFSGDFIKRSQPLSTAITEDIQNKKLVLTSPNPCTDIVSIKLPSDKITSVSVFNVLGELVYEVKTNQHQQEFIVQTSHLSDGMYYLKIQGEVGVYTGKFMKE